MFWRFGGYANISTIDTLLDKPDVSLEEILDDSDLIQEIKQHNTKLIEVLRKDDVLQRLFNYVIAPGPPPDAEEEDVETSEAPEDKEKAAERSLNEEEADRAEKARLKYSYVACEVLSSEAYSIVESMMQNEELLREFWTFIRRPAPLDPVQAGYFTKVNETLLERKTADMVIFLKTLDDIVPAMLKHVDCPMMMDLLLKIISLDKVEGGQGTVDWLQAQNPIPTLLSYLSPEHPSSTQTSAGDFLKAIITISANAAQNEASCIGPNGLTRQLVSEPCMETLITAMLRGGNPLTVGVGIVIEVIRKNNSDYDQDAGGPDTPPSSHDPIYLGTLLKLFAKHVPDFMELILSSKHTVTEGDKTKIVERGRLSSAWGTEIEPLGFDRFKTCELMAELLHCSNMALLNQRGSEAYVKERDAERERLKAQGILDAAHDADTTVGYTDDDAGFMNGASSSAFSESSPDEFRKLEVANTGEDEGFETVAASDALHEELKEAMSETTSDTESEKTSVPAGKKPRIDLDDEFVDEPLISPGATKTEAPEGSLQPEEQHPEPVSPGTGLAEEVTNFKLEDDKDTEDTHDPESATSVTETEVSPTMSPETTKVERDVSTALPSPHPEDKPAPLFSTSGTQPASEPAPTEGAEPPADPASAEPLSTLGDEASMYLPHVEIDLDGRPVVGDYLKVMFVQHQVVPTILNFFFRFPWNNFLHNVVYDVVQQVFNGTMERGFNRTLAIDLFSTGKITEQIMQGQARSDEAQAKHNMRLGYMGHLTLVAEEVVKFSERHPAELLSQIVMDNVLDRQWIDYVEQTLSETRERDNAILGGVRPDVSLGGRQAVLNAVSAAQGYGGSSALASAGLTGGGGATGLDSAALVSNSGSLSGGSFGLGSGSLLSGFGSSSDDEDEEMEEADEEEKQDISTSAAEGSGDKESSDFSAGIPFIAPPPAPLNIPPSRARRQLAARLALHKQKADEAAAAESGSSAFPDFGHSETSDISDPFALDAPEEEDVDLTGPLSPRSAQEKDQSAFYRRMPLDIDDEDDDEEMGEMVGPSGEGFGDSDEDDESLGEPLDFSKYGIGRPIGGDGQSDDAEEDQQDESDGEDEGLVEIMVPGKKA